MAIGILSTKSGGTLTAQQHASQMLKSGLDFCQLEYGNNFSFNTVGLTLNVGSGMGQCYGRTFQFISGNAYTITANRNFRLIVRVNLATSTANSIIEEYVGTIPGKTFSDDLINNLLGTHDVEIGRGTSTSTTVSFTKTITLNNSITNNMNANFQTPKITASDGTALYPPSYSLTKNLASTLNGLNLGLNTVSIQNSSPANPGGTFAVATIHKTNPNSPSSTNGSNFGTAVDLLGGVYSLKNAFGTNEPKWETVFPVIFPGTIVEFAGTTAPKGWFICDGSTKSISQYPELYNVIGNIYGSAISGEFRLPDKRGRVSVGRDGFEPPFSELGKTGGAITHVLDESEMPFHSHKVYNAFAGSSTGTGKVTITGFPVQKNGEYALETESVGQNLPHNNLQPYITTNFIIKY